MINIQAIFDTEGLQTCVFIPYPDWVELKSRHKDLEDLENCVSVHSWWQDENVVKEFEGRYEALENGTDRGASLEELDEYIDCLRKKD